MQKFRLPADYVERPEPAYFDDSLYFDSEIVHQPEVYEAASFFARAPGRTTIIDIGCGNGRKLRGVQAARHVGVDFGANISFCRRHFPSWGEWIDADLSRPDCIKIAGLVENSCVVVCADVIEHMVDPEPLVALLAECHRRGAIVVTSTPDRARVHGAGHNGPPSNKSHVREWALAEYDAYLADRGLPSIFAGYTLNNNIARELKTIITIHDVAIAPSPVGAMELAPLAILSAYNEADVIGEVCEDLLDQGCDVVAIDNWSTDQTWALLDALARRHPTRLAIERFPSAERALRNEWRQILHRKEVIARDHPHRWIIHTDADELRRSPFPGMTLAEALNVARRCGANRVNFNLINFRPTDERSFEPGTLQSHFTHFEYGTRPGHFKQGKAWYQGTGAVDLASSGGHSASFPGAVDFRYKFLLRHYPIRSAEHGRRKVMSERRNRWSTDERAMGWHTQYDDFSDASSFLWPREALQEFGPCFWRDHGVPIMTDIAERRTAASRIPT